MPASFSSEALPKNGVYLWMNWPFDQSGQGDIHGTRYR